ncbi:DUF4190 domain-containing protein [Spirillospora sp. NPDC049652]
MSERNPPPDPSGRTGGTSGWAVASLIFSILWLCGAGSLLAIVCGAIALPRIRRKGQSGRGLAVAGLVLGVLGLLAGGGIALLAGVADHSHRTENADILLEAEGTGGPASAGVTYSFGEANASSVQAALPWRKRERRDLSGLDFVRVDVRNDAAAGTVSCRITIDGKVAKTAAATGGHRTASCVYNPIAAH